MASTPRRGLGLIEILIALVLLGMLGAGVSATLVRGSQRSADVVNRETARQLASGWVERIRAAGATSYDIERDSFPVNPRGERVAGPSPYSVRVERVISCLGAIETGDAGLSTLDPSCAGTGRAPVVTYRVAAFYPNRGGDEGVVSLATSFGERTAGSGAARSCPGGQRWDGSACTCPAGTTFDGTVCGCPAGQTWDGMSCVPTVCSIAGGTAQTRFDPSTCAGPRVGGTTERRDLEAATCNWGPWTLVSATCGCPNPGEVYSAVTNRCFVPPPPQTRTLACPVGFVGSITEMNSYDVVNDGWLGWVRTADTCTPCTPAVETRSVGCPAGESGSVQERRTQNMTCTAWGGWVETSRSCAPVCVPATETRSVACPAGFSGTIEQVRTQNGTCSAWGAWTETGRSCVADPHPLVLELTPSTTTPLAGTPMSWTLGVATTGTVATRMVSSNGASTTGSVLALTYAVAGVYEAVAAVRLTSGEFAEARGWVEVRTPPPVRMVDIVNWEQPDSYPVLIGRDVWMPHARHSWEIVVTEVTNGWMVTEIARAKVDQSAGACGTGWDGSPGGAAQPERLSDGDGRGYTCYEGTGGWHTMVQVMSGDWPWVSGAFFVLEHHSYPWSNDAFSPLIRGANRLYGKTMDF